MVGPAARLAQCIHVGAAKEIGLHIHLVDVELSRLNLLVYKLVAGVEAARVTAHGDQTGLLLQSHHLLTLTQHIAQRNLHLHMLARLQTGQRLRRMHLRGRAQNHCVHFFDRQTVFQIGGDVGNAVFISHLLRFGQFTPNQRHHFHAFDKLDAVQVFDAECAGSSESNFEGHGNSFVIF